MLTSHDKDSTDNYKIPLPEHNFNNTHADNIPGKFKYLVGIRF